MHTPPELCQWIVRSTTDGLWIFDDEGQTVYANDRLAAILGYTPAEMPGLNVADALDEVGREQLLAHLAELARVESGADNTECSFLRKDGSRIWVLVSHSPLVDDEGQRRGWLHRVTELTERRLLLEKVLSSEQQLAEAQSIAKVGSWEWDIATDVVEWSDELYRVYNVEPQEFEATYEGFLGYVHPDDRETVRNAVASAFEGADSFSFQARIIRRGGEEAWINGRGVAVRDEQGAPVRMNGTAHDITETVLASQELEAASDRLGLLQAMTSAANETSSLAEAIHVAVDEISGHTGWEPRAAYTVGRGKAGPEALEGSNLPAPLRLGPTALRSIADRRVAWGDESDGNGGRTGVLAIPVVVAQQVRCIVELVTGLGLEPGQAIVQTIQQVAGQLARVGEREHSEAELSAARDAALDASQMKSDFLATMSHEIRTPLNGVIGLSELLLRTELSPRQRQLAGGVEQAGRTLLGLINDILDLSKIEAGKLEIETVDFEVREVLEQATALMAAAARAQSIELLVHCAGDVPTTLRGDPVRFGQIVTNLLSNAVKFTHDGDVVVRAKVQRRHGSRTVLRVEVTDTGIGIAPETQARLFDAFAQADTSTTRRFGGTGLGLTISRQLAEALGGEIGVISEIGSGSTFWFTVALETPTSGQRPDGDEAAVAKLRGLRVLVVDDNATNRLITAEQLALWDVQSTGVVSAREAMVELRQAARSGQPYQVALVDMCMPNINGLQLAELIRADELVAAINVLMLSSITEVDEEAVARLGIDTCLVKPVLPSTLLGSLCRVVGEPQGQAEEAEERGSLPKGQGRVLVAEDNPVNQLVAQGMLESLGYEVQIAQDGVEAVEATAGNHSFVAVLMDCQMPRLDGYTATEKIRSQETHLRRVPIIAMTAAAISGERERCLASGMDDFLVKPVDRELLQLTLQRWLRGPVRLQALAEHASEEEDSESALDLVRMNMLHGLKPGNPSMFHRFVDSFLTSAPNDVAAIVAAVAASDADALSQHAHRLKGSAMNLGVPHVAKTCGALERAAEARDLDGVEPLARGLEDELARAVVALRRISVEGLNA